MDVIEALMTLRNRTDAGTPARKAVDWLDDYILAREARLDTLRAAAREFLAADDASMYAVPPDSEWHAYALTTQRRLQAARNRLAELVGEGGE